MEIVMATEHEISEPKSFVSRYIFSTDHKVIAVQYIITGLIWALVGGLLGLFFRTELTWPERGILTPEAYNAAVTLHGAIMVFWVGMPILIGGFANLCIPLMVGAKDMAFPRLNMLSYWVFFLSSVVLALSFFVPGGPASYGWTIYPPLSSDPRFTGANLGGILLILALALEFASILLGGINYITTTINLRTKGMSMMRLPIIVWLEVIASILFLLSVTPLIAGAVLLLLDILVGTHFFRVTAEGQGDPVLWQHLFWFFGHPEVYVLLFPALGIIAEVLTSHSRKPIFRYKTVIYANIAAGIMSFVVWAHHMFVAGINPFLAFPFAILTIMISVPFAITLICIGLTLWGGSIRFTTANLFAIGSFVAFIIGGLTGLFLGGQATDIYFHDTYFVVAHFHYTLFPTAILAGLAGIYHWFPKMFGRMMDERWGKVHFWGTFIGFNLFAFSMFFLGLAGHPRRYSAITHIDFLKDFQWIHFLSTIGTILLIVAQIPFIINFFASMFVGKKAGDNPWRATTLEWLVGSPPPHHNWGNMIPVVVNGPYDYSPEGEIEDFKPQGVLIPKEEVLKEEGIVPAEKH